MPTANEFKQLAKAKKLSVNAIAEQIGMSEPGLRHAINRNLAGIDSTKIYELANLLGTSIEHLLGRPQLGMGPVRGLAVRHKVGAGGWIEAEDFAQVEDRIIDIEPLYAYRHATQWVEELEGESMNLIFPPGTLLHVADSIELGYAPRHGDIVVVERTRDGGHLRERSVKQIAMVQDGLELWPRSASPRWQKPILLNEHPDDESVGVEIKAIVLRGIIETLSV